MAVLFGGGCGDDATSGDTTGQDAAASEVSQPDAEVSQPDAEVSQPDAEVTQPEDSTESDASDSTSPSDATPDPEGTRYPIASSVGVVDGTFETNLSAAFDGQTDQTAAASAETPIFENIDDAPLLYREFNCELRLRRVEVHPPSDSYFLHDPTNYPQGGAGTVTVVGRRADIDYWYTIATKSYGTDGPVIFGPDDVNNASDYVAYGVTFTSAEPLVGTVQVAEVALFGYCATPDHTIAWSTTEWLCTGVECVTASNAGGTQTRAVTCARDTGGYANSAMCAGDEPLSEGEGCSLECSHELVYVGARPFTYDNGSGWLHEGLVTRRAGPLPSEVSFGTTVAAIEGKPCSIPTVTPNTYFVGLSCLEELGSETQYCAFRCE